MNENTFRNRLINETIREAANSSPFYEKIYSGIDIGGVNNINDLKLLPIIDKEQVRSAGDAIRSKKVNTDFVQYTAGSTGKMLMLHRSNQEAAFIHDFFLEVGDLGNVEDDLYVLALQDIHHGTAISLPSKSFVINAAVKDDILLGHCIDILQTEFEYRGSIGRINTITGPASQILILTSFILENNIPADDFCIKNICCTSRYLTSRQIDAISKAWGCAVYDRYSLSEIFGGATRCLVCNSFHFDLHVIPEVVDEHNKIIEGKGVGELLLTSLYPFSQRTPLIRYRTGDLFQLIESSCSRTSYKYLGRKKDAFYKPNNGNPIGLFGAEIIDTLDQFPLIRRTTHYHDLNSIDDHSTCGRPIFECFLQPLENTIAILIKIELTVVPGQFENYLSNFKNEIKEELCTKSQLLKDSIDNQHIHLEIELVGPRQLKWSLQPSSTLAKSSVVWKKIS